MLIEVPLDDCLVIDCLNLDVEFFDTSTSRDRHQAYKASRIAAKRVGHTIVVTTKWDSALVREDSPGFFVDCWVESTLRGPKWPIT